MSISTNCCIRLWASLGLASVSQYFVMIFRNPNFSAHSIVFFCAMLGTRLSFIGIRGLALFITFCLLVVVALLCVNNIGGVFICCFWASWVGVSGSLSMGFYCECEFLLGEFSFFDCVLPVLFDPCMPLLLSLSLECVIWVCVWFLHSHLLVESTPLIINFDSIRHFFLSMLLPLYFYFFSLFPFVVEVFPPFSSFAMFLGTLGLMGQTGCSIFAGFYLVLFLYTVVRLKSTPIYIWQLYDIIQVF